MSDRVPGLEAGDEPPPILGTWRRVYGAVVVYLAVLILAFWAFGRSATP